MLQPLTGERTQTVLVKSNVGDRKVKCFSAVCQCVGGIPAPRFTGAGRKVISWKDRTGKNSQKEDPPFNPNPNPHPIAIVFKINFWRTQLLFVGHSYPCFGLLEMSTLGCKAREVPFVYSTSHAKCAILLAVRDGVWC